MVIPSVMNQKRAIALLSGGLDSSIALALALEEGWEIALTLTFDYNQRARVREQEQAGLISEHFKIAHRDLLLPWFKDLTAGGRLLGGGALPQPKLNQLSDSTFVAQSAKAVWVPNRNGVFLEIAAQIAEDLDLQGIVVGFNREEAATFPDNSTAYLAAINGALSYSTANHVQVFSPTATRDKIQIVQAGKDLAFPFPLLWSCYEAGHRMCGSCESCARLKRALVAGEVRVDEIFENASLL
jgi:7-cyano-7-deazaguanine synthase